MERNSRGERRLARQTLDLWVGLFVLGGILALFMLAFKVGNLSSFSLSDDSYVLYANFENVGSLKVRAPVKSAGVVVGRVAEIRFDNKDYVARVTFSLDKRYQFPKDTFASISTSGLLGEQYVGLDPGGDSEYLKPGDTLAKTQSAVVLEKLIGQFLFNKAQDSGNGK
ncbi:MAG TPA: outer membrane lipid asymmetry maintenance protein MlaD [Burkholderiales bacterium]|nr:outer membrane lipid asymmetry maintenance protein MlaD [Burkholderiales bacterium]